MNPADPSVTLSTTTSKKLCVGLTGGIGCGKSTVADSFKKLGGRVIDTDVIAHHLTQSKGIAIPTILSTFGNEYIDNDGALNRDKMRELIFSEVAEKKRLEMILHPLILEQVKAQMLQLHTMPYIIIVIPLLLESPAFQHLIQRILVVDCNEDTQIARVASRNSMSKPEINNIIAQQTPRAERLRVADDIIHNDSDIDNLVAQVTILHKRYLNTN